MLADNIIRTTAPILLKSQNPSNPGDGGETPSLGEFAFNDITLPQAKAGKPYSYELIDLISWTGLPASQSLSFSSSYNEEGISVGNGKLYGTPLLGGSKWISLSASDSSKTLNGNYILNVLDLTLTPRSVDTLMVGRVASEDISTSAQWLGLNPQQVEDEITWSLASDSAPMPTGMTLSSRGVLTGKPLMEGDFTIKVESKTLDFTRTADFQLSVDLSSVNLTSVVAGSSHGCGITPNQTVKCWGYGNSGLMGDGTNVTKSTPVDVLNIYGVTQLSSGYDHVCAKTSSGEAYCWGSGANGKLGNGFKSNSNIPVKVSNLSGVLSISAGDEHTCAVVSGGDAYCWGYNSFGRLGNGTSTQSSVPVKVSMPVPAKQIAAGYLNSYALGENGVVYGWGIHTNGALTTEHTVTASTPVALSQLTGVTTKISASFTNSGVCALKNDHTAMCFGRYPGNGETTSNSAVKVELINVKDIRVGTDDSCALLINGGLRCWGSNSSGELGDNTNIGKSSPTLPVAMLQKNVVDFAIGTAHTCAIFSSGGTRCWGAGSNSRLGNGTNNSSRLPLPVLP